MWQSKWKTLIELKAQFQNEGEYILFNVLFIIELLLVLYSNLIKNLEKTLNVKAQNFRIKIIFIFNLGRFSVGGIW